MTLERKQDCEGAYFTLGASLNVRDQAIIKQAKPPDQN